MKGQSMLLTHAIMVGITISLVMVVIITFNNIRLDYQSFTASNSMEQACYVIASSVESIHFESSYSSPTETAAGKAVVKLPEKIADLEYRTIFINRTMHIITSVPGINTTCRMGPDATYMGSTSGGLTEITFTQNTGGGGEISVRKVA